MGSLDKRSSSIDYLKAFASIMVVLGHSLTYMTAINVDLPLRGEILQLLLYSVHVPLFFAIAAYLCHEKPIKPFIIGKIKRIIIPYYTFTILKLAYSAFISKEFSHESDLPNILFDVFIKGSFYWFSYSIFIMFLISPFFWNDEKHTKRRYIIFTALFLLHILIYSFKIVEFPDEIDVFGVIITRPFHQVTCFIQFFPYFLLGFIFREKQERLCAVHKKYKGLLIVCSVMLIAITTFYVAYSAIEHMILSKLVLALCLSYLLILLAEALPRDNKLLTFVGRYSYQIMLFDGLFRVILFKVIMYFTEVNLLYAIIISLLNVGLTCAACFLIGKIPFVKTMVGI